MLSTLLMMATLFAADPDGETKPVRKPHPLAPSLPQLTDEEEAKVDDIINRFIRADSGLTRGEEAKEAQRDFDALGPETIPALIRGLNRAAKLDHSCPTLMIAKKLSRLLASSDDQKLLEFTRDEIGTGVPRNKHGGILADLRTQCLLRKNALARANPPVTLTSGAVALRNLSNAELLKAASKESGDKLKTVLAEFEQRRGPDVIPGFLMLIQKSDATETQQTARDYLDKHLARQTSAYVKQQLKEPEVELQRAAVRTAGKMPPLLADVIEALGDDNAELREDAHRGLLRWSKGEDFGPAADADKAQREAAQMQWRSWLARQPKR